MIVGDRFYYEFDQTRMACITGSLSVGKTNLAFDIALRYWRMGFRVLSNVGNNFVELPLHALREQSRFRVCPLYKTVVIMDEAGEYIREQKLASSITRSAGKANYYCIFSGKRLPHKNLQEIIVETRFDFYSNYGLPCILWRCTVEAHKNYSFNFFQWRPSQMWGTYSTISSSGGIEKILGMAVTTVDRLAELEGEIAGVSASAGIGSLADEVASGGIAGFSSENL